jgi:allophanate hydrolase subunit 2
MGIRLEGQPLPGGRADMVSAAVLPGTLQLPPDGRPIILLADAQTIGGYPVVGQVIAADLPRAAQLRPGDVVQWRQASLDEAHAAYREQAAWLATVRESLAGRVCWRT